MARRQCDDCGANMGAYEPRTRVGDQMLCDACKDGSHGGMVSKTATWSRAQHPQPIIHPAGSRATRPLQTGDTLLYDNGFSEPIVGHAESLLMTPSGIKHRRPLEGDDSQSIRGETAEDRADMESKLDVGSPEEQDFLRSNPTGPTKWSSRRASADHDVLYHLTDKHHFALDPEYAPQDNTFAIEDRSGRKGLYGVTDSWGVNSWRAKGYQRPYVAEVHVPKGFAQDGRWGNEKFLPAEHYDKATVHRVMPVDQHEAETYEGAEPGGRDVRDFTPKEHSQHLLDLRNTMHDEHGWGWNEFNDQHEHVGTDEDDDEGMPVRRDRSGNVMTQDRYAKKGTLPKTQKCSYCKDQATKRLLWAEGMAYIPVCDSHESDGRHRIEVTNKDEVAGVKPIKSTATQKVAHDSGDGMTVFHCFAGETRYLTQDGVKTLAETVGTVQRVMTGGDDLRSGRWADAIIHEFGEQHLLKVTLRRNKQIKVIRATPEHRWLVTSGPKRDRNRVVATTDLRRGHRLPSLRLVRFDGDPDRDAIRMGFVFGDGTIARGFNQTYGVVSLYGGKMDLAKYFDEIANSQPTSVVTPNGVKGLRYSSGMKGFTKELPSLNFPREYLLGWLMGYFAADGSVSATQGQATLSCASMEVLEHVRDVATVLGIGTYSPTSRMRVGLGTTPSLIHEMGLAASDLGESFFLRDDQRVAARAQHHDRFGWTVVSVEDNGEVENVYCPRVPETETFVLEDNIHTGQCPFCGSGQVLARSDRTIECQFCHQAFTVQVQPIYPNFPQTIDGQPMDVPGMPGQIGGAGMGEPMPPGAGGEDPNAPMDPSALGADGEVPPTGEADAEADEDSGSGDSSGHEKETGNPFAKKTYLTAKGFRLPEDEYVRHLAIITADNPLATAAAIKIGRLRDCETCAGSGYAKKDPSGQRTFTCPCCNGAGSHDPGDSCSSLDDLEGGGR